MVNKNMNDIIFNKIFSKKYGSSSRQLHQVPIELLRVHEAVPETSAGQIRRCLVHR